MTSTMMKKSMPEAKNHISPLANNRIDKGYENLKVKLLFWPDEKMFKRLVYKATLATRGSDVSDDEYDEKVVEEAFAGGLNQVLEVATCSFEISGCSRGLTHELVRTRKASFSQQSFRHTAISSDAADFAVRMPIEIANSTEEIQTIWKDSMEQSRLAYKKLVNADIPFQDARTVVPIGTETYVIASYPLNEFIGTFAYRGCYLFYPEIVVLFHKMKEVLIEKCPWIEPHVKIGCEKTRPSSDGKFEHQCVYMGWEEVSGMCPLAWGKDENRVWKSSKFGA